MTIRFRIAVLLFLATVLNYLDRQVLSITAPILRHTFGMTAIGYSRLVFAFLLAYTIGQIIAGKVLDILGTRRGLAISMLWWSTAGTLHAAARSLTELAICRFFLGIGEAGNWPGAVKTVQKWFAPKDRAFVTGFFNSGSAVGAIIAPPLVAWTIVHFSWRVAFVGVGALGFVWLIPWMLVHRSAASRVDGTDPTQNHQCTIKLFRDSRLYAIVAARFFCDPVWWFYVFWLPDYLSRTRGFTMTMIGMAAWVPFLTAGIGNLVGGWISSRLVCKGTHVLTARKIILVISAAVMVSGYFTVAVRSATSAIGIVSLVTFAYSCWAANILTLPADLFAPSVVGAATGSTGTAAGVGGMLHTLAVGWMVDHWSYRPVFLLSALMPLAAAGCVLMLRPVKGSAS